ncbi:MAG: flagellar basal body rod protein FlgB [Limnochordia bacterium]|nr:flagellar basal body rod protein FlgB [Bacillota bacterium]HOB08028.1 flagellar basal body rod protein FlgB [Limnochordia bacterium]NLH31633.1 flagellar basal body rod protein FlgB [Bacillota bacterium]HPT92194.1 flagellar basal body rod protein FlgB [Limnochordia bacterium]HPZ29819.1 flagellar basal body rod protein FlgB [Limnochordia bacterium]
MFRLVDLVTQGLDAASLRHKILSNNLANVNTPGFRRSDVDFSDLFEQSASMPIRTTHPQHVASSRRQGSGIRIVQDKATSIRNDGNNVDADREMILLLENQLHYQAMADVITRNLGVLRLVIGEGR